MRTSLSTGVHCSVLAVLVTAGLAACGSGTPPDADPQPGDPAPTARTYLALGDSIPFGFAVDAPGGDDDPAEFVGYPELVGADLDLAVVNASCPGETTGSFLGEEAPGDGCIDGSGEASGFRDDHPLHVDYEGSQLDYAVSALQDRPGVELVTLQIGANDVLVCRSSAACGTAEGVAGMAARVRDNADSILSALRDEGGYDGRIVVLGFYARDYADAGDTDDIVRMNEALAAAAEANGADVADAFGAFGLGAWGSGGRTIDAGLVVPGDIHPTPAGQRLLADTVEQVLVS